MIQDPPVPINSTMRSFKHYIIEVLSFNGSTSFAFAGGRLHHVDERVSTHEHPTAFPHIYFPGHVSGDETNSPNNRRMIADMWGRLDHENKVFHILSGNEGLDLASRGFHPRIHPKQAEREVNMRLRVARQIQEIHPNYKIHIGYHSVVPTTIVVSFEEHEKMLNQYLSKHLNL